MTKIDLSKFKRFFKNGKTAGLSMDDLYKNFSLVHTVPRADFEIGLLELGKKVAKDLKEKCLEYLKNEGEFGYEKICREQSPVTKEFWDVVSSEIRNSTPPIESLKVPESLKQLSISPETLQQEPTLDYNPKVTKSKLPKATTPITAPNKEDEYYKLLPIGWATLSSSERISFVQKIQHEGFKEYVLSIDPRTRKFFSHLDETPKKSTKFKLYVTLFQIQSKNYSKESKNLLRCFVESLNTLGRANLQYVECLSPEATIEIREVR